MRRGLLGRLYRDRRRDMRVEPVAVQAEVVVIEANDIRDVRVDIHHGQRIRRARAVRRPARYDWSRYAHRQACG